jgi:hypothetical protein
MVNVVILLLEKFFEKAIFFVKYLAKNKWDFAIMTKSGFKDTPYI